MAATHGDEVREAKAALGGKSDRELLASVLSHIEDVTDEGPFDEGWKSPRLRALVDEIEGRVAAAPAPVEYDNLRKRIVQAIADPGHFTPRGDNYEERIVDWSTRAVLSLFETVDANTMGHSLECGSRKGERCDCPVADIVMLRLTARPDDDVDRPKRAREWRDQTPPPGMALQGLYRGRPLFEFLDDRRLSADDEVQP